MTDRETFRIYNRHLSESQWREEYARRTGRDVRDIDDEIWREREARNRRYSELDND